MNSDNNSRKNIFSMPWYDLPINGQVKLAMVTFAILALELAVIRWMGSQIRIVAYFQNLVLMAAFLGMGLGVTLGRNRPAMIHWCLPALAFVAFIIAMAPHLGLVHFRFPDPSISLWGSETESDAGIVGFGKASLLVLALFWMVVVVFIFAGGPVGWLFRRLEPVRAYTADIVGSLCGVLVMTLAAALGSAPVVWLAIGSLPILFLSRRPLSFIAFVVVAVLAVISVDGALYSPYNRIDVYSNQEYGRNDEYRVSVNRDFHQNVLNFSDRAIAANQQDWKRIQMRRIYELPFSVWPGDNGRGLVVGAGTGNDVMAAVRRGFTEVLSVEIDRKIFDIGKMLHPEQPYSYAQVKPVINDARAFFEQNPDEAFDVICYGLLDSHAMFSAMSSLRLDNYVYTVEGVRAAWEHLREGGVLSISFSVYAGRWMIARLLGIVKQATGLDPYIVEHGMHSGVTFLVGRSLDESRIPTNLGPVYHGGDYGGIKIPTDDWPFLYLRPGHFPYAYLTVLLLILATAAMAIRATFGPVFGGGRLNKPMFFLGASFMLIETRMITELSLLFGSTWVVNASVFSGILIMIIAGSFYVLQRTPSRIEKWYIPLLLSLLLTWLVGAGVLNNFSFWPRLAVSGIIYGVPVLFAAVIFAFLLKKSADPAAALGANLIGAVVGGLLEYSSMVLGLRAMTLLAAFLYLLSLLFLRMRKEV